MNFIKRFSYLSLLVLFMWLWFVHWDISNLLEISPSSTTGKYYCNTTLTTNIDYVSDAYSSFEFNMKFNTGALILSHNSINSEFTNDTSSSVVDNNYYARWTLPSNASVDKLATTFTIQPILVVPYQTTWSLDFVNSSGLPPTFGTTTTTDGIWIWAWGQDTLSWVGNTTLNFEAYPCIDDTNAPIIYSSSWTPTAIDGWQLLGTQNIDMLAIDWTNSNGHYRYQGLAKTLANYVSAPANVDNQYWVDNTTLNIRINNNGSIESPTLTTTAYTGTETPNTNTWDSVNRGYWIDFTNTNAFEVEKQVTITVTGYDNPNHTAQTHLMTRNFTFNIPAKPTMSITTPINGATFQSPTISPLKFQANDSWAGVDTGSIKIEIPQIMSWATLLMTGHIYSGSELIFTLNLWWTGLGNAGWYEISLIPLWDFPSATWVIVSWFVADLATNAINLSTNNNSYVWSFETRPSCDFYGCNEILDIYIMTWVNYNLWLPYQFTWELLIATWTNPNSPYPYLTWANNDILMCGIPYTWTNINSNFDMYEADWTTSLVLPHMYTWSELYITGLDFTYSNGVITIN